MDYQKLVALCIFIQLNEMITATKYNPQNEMLAARKMKRLFLKNET